MADEELYKIRMMIATNLLQGLVASKDYNYDYNNTTIDVKWAYKVADEILKQGGYVEQ